MRISENILSPSFDSELKSQVTVIGSGPGGSITACLLAEAGYEVLLIEEGPYFSLQSCDPFSKEELIQKYRHRGMTVAFGKPKIAYVEGRCVGGGSEINSGLYHRTPPEILEEWSQTYHVLALSERELSPHFEACEKDLSISPLPYPPPLASIKLREGAGHLGWKSMEVPRGFKYTKNEKNEFIETKQSMSETFIPRALNANCRLLPNTKVIQLRQNNYRWTLQAQTNSKIKIKIVSEYLFICGGAIQTPFLLLKNGVTKNIGTSLRMHPTFKVVAKFKQEINSRNTGVPAHQVKQFSPSFNLGCSFSNIPYLAMGLLDYPNILSEIENHWEKMGIYYAAISSGSGRIRKLPFLKDPFVTYHFNKKEENIFQEALKSLCRCLLESGAVEIYPTVRNGFSIKNNKDLNQIYHILFSRFHLMTVHLFSSCRMGENKKDCATDSFGKLHEFKNLYIGDASLLCDSPSVNPQGTIMAIARRNALHFMNKL